MARRGLEPPPGAGLPEDARWVDAEAVARPWPPAGWRGLPEGAAGSLVFGLRAEPGGAVEAVSLLAVSADAKRVCWPVKTGEAKVLPVGGTMGMVFHARDGTGPVQLVEGAVSAVALAWSPWMGPEGVPIVAVGSAGGFEAAVRRIDGPLVVHAEGDAAGRVAAGRCVAAAPGRVRVVLYAEDEDPADRLAEWLRDREGGEGGGFDPVPWWGGG